MEQRIRNKNRQIGEQRRLWMIASSKIERLIPSSKLQEYRGIKKKECNNFWVQQKLHKARKIQSLSRSPPDNVEGIPVSDQQLKE